MEADFAFPVSPGVVGMGVCFGFIIEGLKSNGKEEEVD